MATTYQKAEEGELRVGKFAVGQVNQVRKDVALQVVNLHHRDVLRNRQTLGKRYANEQRAHQARTAREGDGVHLVDADAGLFESGIYNRNDVLLMGA